MSNLAQFSGGNQPPKNIINAFSTSGASGLSILLTGSEPAKSLKVVSLGATTASILKTVLSITGAGQIDFLCANTADPTSRTLRIKITIDGVVAFDSTTAPITVLGNGISAIGVAPAASNIPMTFQPTFFNASLLVEMASSLTESSLVNVGYSYRTF